MVALLLQGCAIFAPSAAPSAPAAPAASESYAEEAAAAPAEAYEAAAAAAAEQSYSTGGSATVNDAPYDAVFYEQYGVNPFVDAEEDNLSTFGMDVDTAAYTVARRYLLDGNMPDKDSVRTEEYVNYFKHAYPQPQQGEAFSINLESAPAPFGGENYDLIRVGLQAKEVDDSERKPASLVFVIDVSGSMDMENRLGLVKQALEKLVGELKPQDEVAIVVYGNTAHVVLDPTPATRGEGIVDAIYNLRSEGSTNAEAGLLLGYQVAEQMMERNAQGEDRIYRLILCSDGVANVGNTGPDSILARVQEYVDMGITLSTVGFGMGNFNDVLMEQLANDGDGNYSYVDDLQQAERVFVENLTGMLQVVAKDAKIQVEFNPELVNLYRLIGYENRSLEDDEFRDDTKDAGEVGAGHSVTALYEVKLHKGVAGQRAALADEPVATVFIRYQDMDTGEVVETSRPIKLGELGTDLAEASADFKLDAAVAEFAELLKESYWAQESSFAAVREMADEAANAFREDADIVEFAYLVGIAEGLAGQ
jgi:Ca-activated chloride channel family protein